MTTKGTKKNSFATKAVRHGTTRSIFGEHSEAIFQTSSFILIPLKRPLRDSLEIKMGQFIRDSPTPILRCLKKDWPLLKTQKPVAQLHWYERYNAYMPYFLKSGDRILATPSLFGATIQAFETVVKKFDIGIDYAHLTDSTDWKQN